MLCNPSILLPADRSDGCVNWMLPGSSLERHTAALLSASPGGQLRVAIIPVAFARKGSREREIPYYYKGFLFPHFGKHAVIDSVIHKLKAFLWGVSSSIFSRFPRYKCLGLLPGRDFKFNFSQV